MQRYWALGVFSVALRFLAIVNAVLMVLSLCNTIINPNSIAVPVIQTNVGPALMLSDFLLIFGAYLLWMVSCLALFAAGQFILVFIDLAENTRRSATLLEALITRRRGG
jgi:hypothetical protein